MRRNLSFILTMMLVLGGLLLAAVPAKADSGSPLADIRERANGILVQLHTFDNTCVVILGALVKEIDIDILHARQVITVGKGNLTNLLFDTIVTSAGGATLRAIDFVTQCLALLGGDGDDETDGTLYGEVNTLITEIEELEVGKAQTSLTDNWKRFKIIELLEHIVLNNLNSISARLEPLGGLLQEFSAFIFGEVAPCFSDPTECGDITTTIECDTSANNLTSGTELTTQPLMTESGPFSFTQLREIKIYLGQVHQCITKGLRQIKRFTGFKKWIYKGLREVKELLRNTTGFADVVLEGAGVSASTVGMTQVYTLNGRVVRNQSNGLSKDGLANGVYLAVTQLKDATGQIHYQTQKFVVAR